MEEVDGESSQANWFDLSNVYLQVVYVTEDTFKVNRKLQVALIIGIVPSMVLMAGTSAIGMVQATGEFRLNHASTHGTGTLLDGALLETGNARSDVSLSSGGHIAVGPNSKTLIFKDHAVLQSGAADISAANFKLVASKLNITGSGAQVIFDSPTRIRVGAVSSPVEVRNSANLLLARVTPGSPLAFDEAAGGQSGASGPVTITGTLTKNGDQYTITDDTTNVTYVVQGKDLEKKRGKKVKIAGALVPGTGTVATVAVTSIAVVGAAAVAGGLSGAAIAGIAIGGATALGLGIAAGTGAFDSASK